MARITDLQSVEDGSKPFGSTNKVLYGNNRLDWKSDACYLRSTTGNKIL